jgi:hypothetical protein
MEVLKFCVVQSVQTFDLSEPILAEELEHYSSNQKAPLICGELRKGRESDATPLGRGAVVTIEG